jgi:hypothetical protein
MRNKAVSLLLLAALMCTMAGCATVQKKFTRKKKEPKYIPAVVYLEEGPYQKKYSNVYYYKSHYTLWKTWQDDLLKGIGGNRKKTQRNAEEALNHLTQMRNCLKPELQNRLNPLVDELTRYTKKIETGSYSRSEEPGMRMELGKIRRLVENDFYYDKVSDQILPDNVSLSASLLPQPAATAQPMIVIPSPSPSASAQTPKVQ